MEALSIEKMCICRFYKKVQQLNRQEFANRLLANGHLP
jgi:hypothetical protein